MPQPALFNDGRLSDYLDSRLTEAERAVRRIPEDALSSPPDVLVEEICTEYKVVPLSIHTDAKSASTQEMDVDVSRDRDYFPSHGRKTTVPGTRFVISVPFSGTPALFELQPSTMTTVLPHAEIDAETTGGRVKIIVDVPGQSDPETRLRARLDNELKQIAWWSGHQATQVTEYNKKLRALAERTLRSRISELGSSADALSSLGITLEPRQGAPRLPIPLEETISVAASKTIATPAAGSAGDPERTISASDVRNILSLIRHQCRTFEGAPAAFIQLDEEHLRDVIRASLNAVYRVAGAEAFRKAGKTDLCIEAENRAAFVAECKIWTGASGLSKAIDQLLGYLTWRDCSTALVAFNKRVKDFSSLVDGTIEDALRAHPSVADLKTTSYAGEWRIDLRHESGHVVHCQVMAFNLHAS